MIYFFISLLLGAIPDVLYYYLYITKIKEIKSRRIILFILILCIYLIFNLFIAYNFYFYRTREGSIMGTSSLKNYEHKMYIAQELQKIKQTSMPFADQHHHK